MHFDASIIRFRDRHETYRNMSRFSYRGNAERPVGSGRLVLRSLVAWTAGGDSLPAQHLIYLGGPTSAPGYEFHQFSGRAGASQRFEIQFPVPFASFSLGRYGRTPASITLAPFANAAWVDRAGWHPSAGIGALAIFDLLRFDVARGLRDGRWTFSVDVSREFWSIL
jgi:hemolysin activation/secretion protein